jgi:hypothetical protein
MRSAVVLLKEMKKNSKSYNVTLCNIFFVCTCTRLYVYSNAVPIAFRAIQFPLKTHGSIYEDGRSSDSCCIISFNIPPHAGQENELRGAYISSLFAHIAPELNTDSILYS